MLFNDDEIGIGTVEACYDSYIKINSKDGKKTLNLSFNNYENSLNNMKYNKRENIKKYLYWDTDFHTEKTHYAFDLSDNEIYLTRLDNNKYRLEVNITKPDIIYCQDITSGQITNNISFNSLKIDTEFSFTNNK